MAVNNTWCGTSKQFFFLLLFNRWQQDKDALNVMQHSIALNNQNVNHMQMILMDFHMIYIIEYIRRI